MSKESLDQVAVALGVSLPEFYRGFFLRNCADLERLAAQEPPRATPFFDSNNLIYYNRLVRSEPIGRDGLTWPANHFVIGVHFCEDFWFIKLDGSDECVWTCWGDTGAVEKASESLEDLLEELWNDSALDGTDARPNVAGQQDQT